LHATNKKLSAGRQFGGINAIGLQRVVDQQLALHAITGIKAVREGYKRTCHGQNQNKSTQIETEKTAKNR